MDQETIGKVKGALEHEKAFWKSIFVQEEKFKSMQWDWENTAHVFQDLAQKYTVLDDSSRIIQIGSAVQDAINFWQVGKRYALDPLKLFYKGNFEVYDKGLSNFVGVGEKLPFKDRSFDVIICQNVIDHTFAPEMVADEFRRILKKDGILFLGLNVYAPDVVAQPHEDPIHFWMFSKADIKQLLLKRDFSIKEEHLCDTDSMEKAQWYWLAAKAPEHR
ncbi:MAG: class I SAM-dependent methyltransferase [Methanotrichaceae archaeon]